MAKNKDEAPSPEVMPDAIADVVGDGEVAPMPAPKVEAPKVAPKVATPKSPTIKGGTCPRMDGRAPGYTNGIPCPGERTYRGVINGGHWYECEACGNGEVGPDPNDPDG